MNTTSVKYFEIIHEIIQRKVQSIVRSNGKDEKEVFEEIALALQHNSNEWFSGRAPEIPYHNPSSRLAYLYSIVPANANLLESVLDEEDLMEFIGDLISYRGKIKICAFGGGPGTEVLGFAKYVEKNFPHIYANASIYLNFLLIDRVSQWLESWYSMQERIQARTENRIVVSGSCWPVDVTDTSGFAQIGDIFEQDIYILSYVLSEIFDEQELDALTDFINIMAVNAPDGSKFIFIDRDEPRLKERVKEISRAIGLDLGVIRRTNSSMSIDEQKSVMQDIEKGIGRSPRLRWDAFYAIGTKEIPF